MKTMKTRDLTELINAGSAASQSSSPKLAKFDT